MKNADLADIRGEKMLEHGVAEATRTTGNHEGLACKLIISHAIPYQTIMELKKLAAAVQ